MVWLFRVWFLVFRLGGLEFLGFRVFSVFNGFEKFEGLGF